jgi:uncharacterized protein
MARTDGFEWDAAKERANLSKHGLAFAEAAQLFRAPSVIEDIDDRFDYGEERLIAFGPVRDIVLCCVYTWRGARRRIISLRKANVEEVERYYKAIAP